MNSNSNCPDWAKITKKRICKLYAFGALSNFQRPQPRFRLNPRSGFDETCGKPSVRLSVAIGPVKTRDHINGTWIWSKKLVSDFTPSFNAAPVPGALQRAAP
jgi:hypothetical protein